MSPVHRYHHGQRIVIPTDLLVAIGWYFDDGWDDIHHQEPENWDLRECHQSLAHLRAGTVRVDDRYEVDAGALARLRNLADIDLLSGGQGCAEFAIEVLGHDQLADGEFCWECEECRALVLRDYMDLLFDRAGFSRPPYLPTMTDDAASDFARVFKESR